MAFYRVSNGGTPAFTIQYYGDALQSIYNYQYISKQFLTENGYSSIKVTVTSGSAYLYNNNSLGGTPTRIGQVNAGNSQTFNVSQVTQTYLQIGANYQATFEFT